MTRGPWLGSLREKKRKKEEISKSLSSHKPGKRALLGVGRQRRKRERSSRVGRKDHEGHQRAEGRKKNEGRKALCRVYSKMWANAGHTVTVRSVSAGEPARKRVRKGRASQSSKVSDIIAGSSCLPGFHLSASIDHQPCFLSETTTLPTSKHHGCDAKTLRLQDGRQSHRLAWLPVGR